MIVINAQQRVGDTESGPCMSVHSNNSKCKTSCSDKYEVCAGPVRPTGDLNTNDDRCDWAKRSDSLCSSVSEATTTTATTTATKPDIDDYEEDWVECTTLPPLSPAPIEPPSCPIDVSATSRWKRRRRRWRVRTGQWVIIPADHPLKILWDVCTMTLSLISLYSTHKAIRDRSYDFSPFVILCESWFLADILLNFFTSHTINGQLCRNTRAVWARYLTTWFVIDALSLFPWENVFVKPIVEMHKKRSFLKKTFFRTRAVMQLTTKLTKNHFRLFTQVVNKTKHAGIGMSSHKLLRMIIRYLPKYLLFFRNMRGVLAVRLLRQIHWTRKLIHNVYDKSSNTALKTTKRIRHSIRKHAAKVRKKKAIAMQSDFVKEDCDSDDDATEQMHVSDETTPSLLQPPSNYFKVGQSDDDVDDNFENTKILLSPLQRVLHHHSEPVKPLTLTDENNSCSYDLDENDDDDDMQYHGGDLHQIIEDDYDESEIEDEDDDNSVENEYEEIEDEDEEDDENNDDGDRDDYNEEDDNDDEYDSEDENLPF